MTERQKCQTGDDKNNSFLKTVTLSLELMNWKQDKVDPVYYNSDYTVA